MDFTPRFNQHCSDYIALDLNCNLYIYEQNFAWMVSELGLTGEPDWSVLADSTAALIRKYCWNSARGLYMDYNYVTDSFPAVASSVTYIAMYAGIATPAQAASMMNNLPLFELDYGITACEQSVQPVVYQWDYPAVWAPLQFLAFKGFVAYGFTTDAQRIASKFLNAVVKNYLSPIPLSGNKVGQTYEKYDGQNGQLFNGEYPSSQMLGWTAGTYVYLNHQLTSMTPVKSFTADNFIFPNPCNAYLKLPLNYKGIIIINDLQGRIYKVTENGNIINTSFLEPGLYFITLKSDSGENTYKFEVVR